MKIDEGNNRMDYLNDLPSIASGDFVVAEFDLPNNKDKEPQVGDIVKFNDALIERYKEHFIIPGYYLVVKVEFSEHSFQPYGLYFERPCWNRKERNDVLYLIEQNYVTVISSSE